MMQGVAIKGSYSMSFALNRSVTCVMEEVNSLNVTLDRPGMGYI